MSLIPELRTDLRERSRRDAAERRRSRLRRRRRVLAGTLAALLAGTTGALAAGGVIRIGPADTDPAPPPRADAGNGVVVAGSIKVLDVRADDPDGGPHWGLRLVGTTRGLGCLTAGRVVGAQIGALGDDGRLYPFSATSTGRVADCGALDRNDRLFYSVTAGRVHASARLRPGCRPSNSAREAGGRCSPASERDLYYGTLGPLAQSITYTTPSGERTVPTQGPEGAYLLVMRSEPSSLTSSGGYIYPVNGPITEIRFRDGTSCTLRRTGATGSTCELAGYQPRVQPLPTRAELATPIRARASRDGGGWTITVRFRARVAVSDAASAYNVRMTSPGATRGKGATAIINRNVARGEVVVQRFKHRSRPGIHRGRVTFHRAQRPGQVPAGAGGVEVGRFEVRIP